MHVSSSSYDMVGLGREGVWSFDLSPTRGRRQRFDLFSTIGVVLTDLPLIYFIVNKRLSLSLSLSLSKSLQGGFTAEG